MRIINGKKFYQKDMDAAIEVAESSHYDGNNHQWYTIYYHQPSGFCMINAQNSGSCWGDYGNRYYDDPATMYKNEQWSIQDYARMVGEINEDDEYDTVKIDFMARIMQGAGKELKDCPKSRKLLKL